MIWPSGRRYGIGLVVAALTISATARGDGSSKTERFRFERALTPAAAGGNRVDVDVALLAGAAPGGSLHDLRLSTADGHEVPYLIVTPEAPSVDTWLHGQITPISATAHESGFELDLGRVARVDRLRLGGLPRPFLKTARVEGSGDRSHYTVLAAQATVFDLPEEQLQSLDVPLGDVQERYVRVTWDNHATPAPPIPETATTREITPKTALEPLRVEVPFERRPSRVGESRFRIRLPGEGLPVVAVELSCGGDHLLRPARLAEAALRGNEIVPVELGRATLRRRTRDGVSASALRVPVDHPPATEVVLAVDDGDNPPLDLLGVTAVLSPQPWIYFETATTAPIVARYGNVKLATPHYDLEAMRGGLDGVRPAPAIWGSPRSIMPVPAVTEPPAGVPLVGAALDAASFALSRPIGPGDAGASGLAAVALDAAVLAHSATLADLRVRDSSGHQVPYLLERRDEPTLVPLALVAVTKDVPGGPRMEPRSSLYRVELPFSSLPPGRFVVSTSSRVFSRHVTLIAPRSATASPRDPEVRTLESREWTHADTDVAAPALALPFSSEDTKTVYVRVDEGDNAALPIRDAHLELPGLRLRFFLPGAASLTLLYGAPALPSPAYDLSLLAPSLAGAVADELPLGPEAANVEAAAPRGAGMPVFWGVLVGAVAILILMLVALLRRDMGSGGSPAGSK